MFNIGDKVRFFQIFGNGPEFNVGYIHSGPYSDHGINKYSIKIGDRHFGVGVKESNITMIEENKRIFNDVDPYGEENWNDEVEPIDKIHGSLYDAVCEEIMGRYNYQPTRVRVKEILEKELGENFTVKCDNKNNTPDIIDEKCLVARISWKENTETHYTDVVYGYPDHVRKVKEKHNI